MDQNEIREFLRVKGRLPTAEERALIDWNAMRESMRGELPELFWKYGFDPEFIERRYEVSELPSELCPPLLRDWAAVREASVNAGYINAGGADGIVYRHRLADHECRSEVEWHNPGSSEYHASQLALIDAYVRLLRSLDLY